MLDLGRRYEQMRGEVLAAVGPRQHHILGPEVEARERELAVFAGARRGGVRVWHERFVGCSRGRWSSGRRSSTDEQGFALDIPSKTRTRFSFRGV